VTDFTARRPFPHRPADVLYVIAARATDAALLVAFAAALGAITETGPTAGLTLLPLVTVLLAFYGAGYLVAEAARGAADYLIGDVGPVDYVGDALGHLTQDVIEGVVAPELVHAGLRDWSVPGQLAELVSTIQDFGPDADDVALYMTADHLRQAQHHISGPDQN
jgi:hypothetical protein